MASNRNSTPRVRCAILGSGNIGTDLMAKLMRSQVLEVRAMAGIEPASAGLARAREAGITACDDGRCAWGLLMDHLGKIPKRQWREAREAILIRMYSTRANPPTVRDLAAAAGVSRVHRRAQRHAARRAGEAQRTLVSRKLRAAEGGVRRQPAS